MHDDVVDDTSGWTVEMVFIDHLDRLFSPLFDMFLEFQRKFTEHAIDALDITDEDVNFYIKHMSGTEAGRAFGYLLRHIKIARVMRAISHEVDAAVAVNGWPKDDAVFSLTEIDGQYEKIKKGST